MQSTSVKIAPRGVMLCAVLLALILPLNAEGQPAQSGARDGQIVEIGLTRDASSVGPHGPSSTSHDGWTLWGRVIAPRDDGVELEFDLPPDVPAEMRRRAWQFPARVLARPGRATLLLNGAELEERLHTWLGDRRASLCGHWVFTWTAIKVDCDPQSVIDILKPFMTPAGGMFEGAPYREDGVIAPAPLRARASASGVASLVARMDVDAEAVRRQRAENDLAVAEMTGRDLSLDAAMQAHAAERISGTLTVTFDFDADRRLRRRTRVMETQSASQNGEVLRQTLTEVVEWRPARQER